MLATLAEVQAISLSSPPAFPAGDGDDVQARAPSVRVGLSRVGVTGVEKVVRIADELFFARFECFVDLSRDQKGAHMSRFEEVVNEAIGEVVLSASPFRAETLAQQIAELVRERQGAERAEVTIAARYPEHRPAPVSGVQTQEIYTLLGRAAAFEQGTRRTVGVSVTGMTACPCAQELVAARARARLIEDGFSAEQIDRILERVPVATHNQRGLATLQIGCIEGSCTEIDAATLLKIAEGSMSSEIYELMKRTDEVAVVEKAHRRPRFVEDCVREMIAGVVDTFPRWTVRASSPPARRTSRRSTSTTSWRNATACLRSCAWRSSLAPGGAPDEPRRVARRGRRRARLTAGAFSRRRGSPRPAASDGAGRRSSRGRRAR